MNQNQVEKLLELDLDDCSTILLWGDQAYIDNEEGQPVMIWYDPNDKWELRTLDTEDIRVVKDVTDWENE